MDTYLWMCYLSSHYLVKYPLKAKLDFMIYDNPIIVKVTQMN